MRPAGAPIRFLTVGRTRRGPLLELEEDYTGRISRYAPCTRDAVAASKARRGEDRRREESAALAARLPARGVSVALDARGDVLSSEEFARRLGRWRQSGGTVFAVGGADGLDGALLSRCSASIAFGRITLPHELALVVLLEQVYRALAREAGHPYARH